MTLPSHTHTFRLVDADGVEHQYTCQEHPGEAGMEIMFRVLALGLPSVVRLAGAALKSEDLVATLVRAVADPSAVDDGGGMAELQALLADVDLDAVARDLPAAMAAAPALTRDVLSRTWRDGKRLSERVEFDLAYKRNYFELLKAVWEVARYNRFFPQLATSPGRPEGATGTATPAASGSMPTATA